MHKRSNEMELMDRGPEYYTQQEYEECLKKLFWVGKLTGIHRDTFGLIKEISPTSVLDVGCGDGRFLFEVSKRFPDLRCLGIDISDEALAYAKKFEADGVNFKRSHKLEKADLILSTLVCHHMTDEELPEFLSEAFDKAEKAVIINDLVRSRAAKFMWKIVAPLLFSNRLITHDGGVSIEKGFLKQEWLSHLEKAQIPLNSVEIRTRFPFRWQVILWKR